MITLKDVICKVAELSDLMTVTMLLDGEEETYCPDLSPFLIEYFDSHQILKLAETPNFLWSEGHYDGPATGVCLYKEKPHWFKRVLGPPDYQPDIIVVVELTGNDFHQILNHHIMWQMWCGTQVDYTLSKDRLKRRLPRPIDLIKNEIDYQPYKDWAKENHRPDINKNLVVGWF